MRPLALPLSALGLCCAALPALAQSPTSDLNRINDSLIRQQENRTIQQQQIGDSNLSRMQNQRQIQDQPVRTGPGAGYPVR
ncbi:MULTISPECIES: hypothetical protein [Methylobacterium]|jgi:hypothetical protein|uniref:Tol-pal system protein YbgF n=1 Tax=Methylobacterium jeotgali TaxID=381630 RepID=A0ABQ4SW52_9HYPH|nr:MULTISPECIES: hypothetical protein [Methylobacterium]PIU06739.1 MAG: hypothetical protein COT56_08010 [Methylobacterium sp. CG09_land_8_20_14_0_10_71_15]PIU14844.1 MAG: hypothetical protein COT28_06395 [Methylobacterium sp. CG08_land_8_20_14_0_20_71_15]GBU18003.1 hypothetical protein AwMethylo_22180 [Methylobacterium sp.]GJE07427.1 hypothetical protein AOPFMNJM_2756 [Methylobacterium jeotgali]